MCMSFRIFFYVCSQYRVKEKRVKEPNFVTFKRTHWPEWIYNNTSNYILKTNGVIICWVEMSKIMHALRDAYWLRIMIVVDDCNCSKIIIYLVANFCVFWLFCILTAVDELCFVGFSFSCNISSHVDGRLLISVFFSCFHQTGLD